MKYYAIRHIPTGKFMPTRVFRSAGRGWSYWEPTGYNGLGGFPSSPPRLFEEKQPAQLALNIWLKGPVGSDPESGARVYNKPPIPRIKSDMEIVPMSLTAMSNRSQ